MTTAMTLTILYDDLTGQDPETTMCVCLWIAKACHFALALI